MSARKATASGIDWNQFDAVIFDVDGTLFDHLAMRPAIAAALLRHVLTTRQGWRDFTVLKKFRTIRDRLALADTTEIGEREFDVTSQATGVSVPEVRKIVERWVYQKPLEFIHQHAFPGTGALLSALAERSVRTGAFSDYPAEDKLRALGLSVNVIRDATSPDVARLKPNPSGFLRVAALLGIPPAHCLIIGDRDDRDGEAARRGGFAYLEKSRRPGKSHFDSYADLVDELAAVPVGSQQKKR